MFDFVKRPLEELGRSVFEPLWAWVMARSWPGRAALLGLALSATAIAYTPSGFLAMIVNVGHYWTASRAGASLVLSDTQKMALDRAIHTLQVAGQGDAGNLSDASATSWSAAQSVVALAESGADITDKSKIDGFIKKSVRPECFCWTELPQKAEDGVVVFISGWVMRAAADMGQRISIADLDSLLKLQDGAGWWPMFPGGAGNERASTYTTAWLLLGLTALRDHKLVPSDRQSVVDAAIARGAIWLASVRAAKSRWPNFPYLAGSPVSESVSALAVHAIHAVGTVDTQQIDQEWLAALPTRDLDASSIENYYTELRAGSNLTIDHFAQVRLPWILIATADAYPSGTTTARGAALNWFAATLSDEKLAQVDHAATQWWRAELLLGLSYLRHRA